MHALQQTYPVKTPAPAIPNDAPEPRPGTTFIKRIALKYTSRGNNLGSAMKDALAPVLGWLKRYPHHAGKLGRIPESVFKAKVKQVVTNRDRYRRYKQAWLTDGFIVLTQHQGRLYVDLQHYDNRWALAHYARKKRVDAARQRDFYDRKQGRKVRCGNAPPPNRMATKAPLEGIQRTSRSTLRPPELALTEQDYLQAQGQTAQPLPQTQEKNLEIQQLPQASPKPTAQAAQRGGAGAPVGILNQFITKRGKPDFAAYCAAMQQHNPEADNTRLHKLEQHQKQQLAKAHKKLEHLKQLRRAKACDVAAYNAEHGLKLSYAAVKSAGLDKEPLAAAVRYTMEAHATKRFGSPEGAIMNSALLRQRGQWGPKLVRNSK